MGAGGSTALQFDDIFVGCDREFGEVFYLPTIFYSEQDQGILVPLFVGTCTALACFTLWALLSRLPWASARYYAPRLATPGEELPKRTIAHACADLLRPSEWKEGEPLHTWLDSVHRLWRPHAWQPKDSQTFEHTMLLRRECTASGPH